MSAGPAALLEVEHLTMRFGGIAAVNDVSFRVQTNEIAALIGPNGAGKTTLFNCLTGFYKPPVGRMQLHAGDGKPFLLERMEGFRIAREARVIRTFQNARLFAGMSVLENLIVAQHTATARASGAVSGILGLPAHRKATRIARDLARHWLDRTGLMFAADELAGSLPYGMQRRLEIARAMCARPRLLCLDEPAAGLNARESDSLNTLLLDIRREHGTSILLVEHDMSVVMRVSDHVIVLDHGVVIADGAPADVRNNPDVIRAYLGAANGTTAIRAVAIAC